MREIQGEKEDRKEFVDSREFCRVDAYLPFEVRKLPLQERGYVRCRFPGQSILPEIAKPPQVEDKVLSDWLALLDAKLEYIINTLQLNSKGFSAMPCRQLNISGGGMSFAQADPVPAGEVLEIKTVFYTTHPVPVYLYGEVISSMHRDNGYWTAVRFVYIDDPVRDEIVRFVFERQREMIRKKRD